MGIIFDKNLSLILHINYLRPKCNKAINLFKVMAHIDWGADKKSFIKQLGD